MKQEELQAEAAKLAAYIQSLGSGFRVLRAEPLNHAGAIIVDAVLQVGHGWKTHVEKRIKRIQSDYPDAATISGLLRLLATVGEKELLDWKGKDEQMRFRQTVEFFSQEKVDGEKINTVTQLTRWLASDANRDRLLTKSQREDRAGIPRVGEKTADYYRAMVGLPDAVAVDSLIVEFLREAEVRGRSRYHRAKRIVQLAATILSVARNTVIRPIDLDLSIWEYQLQRRVGRGVAYAGSGDDGDPEGERKDEYEMNKHHKVLEVTLPSDVMEQLQRTAHELFNVDEGTLARIWIVERLNRLCVGHQSRQTLLPSASVVGASLAGCPIYLNGTITSCGYRPKKNNPRGLEQLAVTIYDKEESRKLPWGQQHEVPVTIVVNGRPHPGVLYIYTDFPQFKSNGAYVRGDTACVQDMANFGLRKGDPVELKVEDDADRRITIVRKLPKKKS